MIFMKGYVSLTTAAMKIGEIYFYSDHRGKKASLSNSMLNHLGDPPFTSWIFLKFLPVVGIIEI